MKEPMNFIFASKLDYTTGKCTHSYNFLGVAKEGVVTHTYVFKAKVEGWTFFKIKKKCN